MLFNPSNAKPETMDESPTKATTSNFSLFKSRAMAKPFAAEIDVDECPAS